MRNGGEVPALLLAGGRQFANEDFHFALALAVGEVPRPRVAYIGAANGDSQAFFDRLLPMLGEAGAGDVTFLRLAREDADAAAAREILSAADIVFLSGGEVEDGIRWLKFHGLDGLLRELHAAGTQFIGISAGTIMMGANWVRWDDPSDDATAALFACLGLVPLTFDTHAEDEDWVELKTALRLMGEGARGYGVPGGGVAAADSGGNLRNLRGICLIWENDGGRIRLR